MASLTYRKNKKAQIALEYMLIVLIVLAFLVPVWLYVTSVQHETNNELTFSYAKNTVDKIASTSDLIYSQGPPAKVKVRVYIPGGVIGYNITNNTVNLILIYGTGYTDVFAVSKSKLNGTLPITRGTRWIQLEAKEEYVQIDPV